MFLMAHCNACLLGYATVRFKKLAAILCYLYYAYLNENPLQCHGKIRMDLGNRAIF